MSKTMKAVVVRSFGASLEIDEVPVPEPAAGQVQVRIQASGVCHTDLHATEGDWPVKPMLPLIPGQEGVGYVSAVGPGVKHVKEGEWVAISGIGGLGHVAVQYPRAMGLNVAAVDIADDKLVLAAHLGAELTVNAAKEDPAEKLQRAIGGAHGVLVTAVSNAAFAQALGMVRRGGTVSLNGLPPGDFPLPIFDVVLKGITVRGSIVGTRLDLQESLEFARDGLVTPTVSTAPLEQFNEVFDRMREGRIDGRVVIGFA